MTAAIRNLCLAAVLTFGFVQPVLADADDDARAGFDAESKGDFANALKHYRVAALAGSAYAQGNLGNMYRGGRGTAKDMPEAMRWFKAAAAQHYADAEFSLGNVYETGDGVKPDFTEAAKWYQQAADQGYTLAESALGTLYASGNGVTPDKVQAYKWYSLASDKDDTAKRRRDTLKARMTPAQVAQADAMVKSFKPVEFKK